MNKRINESDNLGGITRKIIKKLGQTAVITFSKEECAMYGITIGDMVDIELVKIK